MDIVKLFGTSDLYAILEIERNVTVHEIKCSYFNLAKKYHPDRVPFDEKVTASEKFNIIHQAYSILSNEEKKKQYDDGDYDVLFSKKTRSGHWEQNMKVVSDDELKEVAETYKNSAKEKEDIIHEVIKGNGSMTHMLNHLPFMRIEDQPRIIQIIQKLKAGNEIPAHIKIKKIVDA